MAICQSDVHDIGDFTCNAGRNSVVSRLFATFNSSLERSQSPINGREVKECLPPRYGIDPGDPVSVVRAIFRFSRFCHFADHFAGSLNIAICLVYRYYHCNTAIMPS